MNLFKKFRGNKVDYKEAFETISERLLQVATDRDEIAKELREVKFDNLDMKAKIENLQDKLAKQKLETKELKKNLEEYSCLMFELSKKLNDNKKPKKDVRSYLKKTEKELY